MYKLLIIFLALGIIMSCSKNKKFDSNQWKYSYEDLGYFYPHREAMLQDLTKGEYLKHLHKNEIIRILGKPDLQSENPEYELIYTIKVEWGNVAPEPVYVKNLIVVLDNKLIFKNFKIEEWER